MMRGARRAVAWSVVVCLGWGIWPDTVALASDETNREIVRTYANFYIKQKDLRSGWQVLLDHLNQDPKDAGAWNLLGILYLESKQYEPAAKTFLKAAEVTSARDPERGIYWYNYADALNRAKAPQGVKEALEQARKFSWVGETAERALEELRPGQPLPALEPPQPIVWTGGASLSVGYDTNVLLSSDVTLAGESATNAASPTAAVLAQAGLHRPLWGGLLQGKMDSGFTYYGSTEAREYNNLLASLSAEWSRDGDDIARYVDSFGNKFDLSYINTNGFKFYNWTDTLKWRASYRHNRSRALEWELPVGYQKYSVETGDDPANDRTGVVLTPMVGERWSVASGQLAFGLKWEQVLAAGDNYQSSAASLPLSWAQPLVFGTSLILGAEPAYISYPKSATSRKDKVLALSGGLGRNYEGWSAFLEYSFKRNVSNVESAMYSKHAVALMVNYEAF